MRLILFNVLIVSCLILIRLLVELVATKAKDLSKMLLIEIETEG